MMAESNAGVKFAEKAAAKGADQMRQASEKLGANAEATVRAAEQSGAAAVSGVTQYQLKALDMARTNAMAALDCAQEVVQVKSPSELLEVWTSHSRRQFERFTEQAKELSSFAQRVTGDALQPLKDRAPL